MATTVGRNDPCPCGSGKKFKHCCIGKPPPEVRRRFMIAPLLVLVAGGGAGIYAGVTRSVGLGAAFIAAGLILAVLVHVFRDPPPPAGKGDAAAINFGK
jgi:hypothetical protein